MAENNTIVNLKTTAKKWLLILTFVLSLFSISGYVSQSLPKKGLTYTEALSLKSIVNKSGISYKRAVLLLYTSTAGYFLNDDILALKISLGDKLSRVRYQYLKKLFRFIKPSIQYTVNHIHYTVDSYQVLFFA